jgi:SAM-dependent methyltransferase
MEQRFTFDAVASVYKATRPGYPEALVDDVVAYAGLNPTDRILEVGCGTGQATRSFSARGFPILATDPGKDMLLGARESLAGMPNVEFLETTFEAFPTKRGEYRLIIAAQSWHWIAPQVRFAKAAEILSPDGTLAVFGHVPVKLPDSLGEQFKQIYLRHMGAWGPPPEAWYLPSGPFREWFDESGLFGPVEHRAYPWTWHHTTQSYTDFLRTRSDHRMLASDKRDQLLDEIAGCIDAQGGRLEIGYETHLYMAHPVSRN